MLRYARRPDPTVTCGRRVMDRGLVVRQWSSGLVIAAIAASIISCGGSPAASVPPPGGGGSAPTTTPADGGGASAAPTAASSPDVGGPGSAHFEITGPAAASGDIPFLRSVLRDESDAQAPGAVQSAVFEDASANISITFPTPLCGATLPLSCGSVAFTGYGDPGVGIAANGWRSTPLPAGTACTWDIAQVTANGGSGSVECTDAINTRDLGAEPGTIKITFTYTDAAPQQL